LDSDYWYKNQQQWPEDEMGLANDNKDDSLEEADLAFIMSTLESFSQPKSRITKHNTKANQDPLADSFCATFTPEGGRCETTGDTTKI
jgi:hypothetical protein